MLKEKIKALLTRRNGDKLFLGLSVVAGVYLKLGPIEVLILAFFIWIILNPVSSKYPAMAMVGFLMATPLLLIFKQGVMAEQTAIYAYYFLVMTVIMGIYEIREDKQEIADKDTKTLN
jgi:hypothetical protein